MPPKGYKKDPTTGRYVLAATPPEPDSKIEVVKQVKKPAGPATKSVPDDRDHAKVIISWKDARGKLRTTQYVMADLTVNEDINEVFNGPKKATYFRLSLEGTVLEKL
jgi:hypothetical protein